ncbi:ABC transporter ATP-binding protein [Evansella cellulosilytica]|uniref:ABC transporter related protein n=1 Tax=Evansella cellulosilytica (strain ATCC 21833 / DSM 2522 / FERM P-1141 / JCM 9156 / N-4) TaxID=649639 RepID=E6TRV9_EVAC2|nr:ABC transporter ATP-binding protein [Evansella cellulosilytica]ADU29482.1 ABC transporter related protein [Evansella cellulosilytica DSM 2522]
MKLVIDHVSKKFKDKWAVKDFSAEMSVGVYALLGPNGSGKTTLMRMLASILKPSSGRILLNDKDISILDEGYRDVLGYLPQEFGVYHNFTAERFLHYFASLKGLDKQHANKKVEEVLELVNLKEERKRKTKTFSGGMKRRLGIAQALLNDPKILVVDEPTAGLDPKERVRFRNLLSDISRERIVLLSTHIVSDIEYIAKEIFIMEQGVLKQRCDVDGLLASMQGKVWKVIVTEEELPRLQGKHKVGNVQRKNNEIELRIVSDEKPTESAIELPAILEDVYLYYFDEEGRSDVQA